MDSSSLYQTAVSVLRSSYLDATSQNGFQYSQVTLVDNDVFLNEYKTFAREKEASGYTKEELEETYAFLLSDNEREAKAVCQNGLRINTRSITTLGDPTKGAYVSKYSDYLHPRPWYHGKSGCIVVFKLIKGRVKFVPENYTTNYTCPTPGYDCHASVNINNTSLETSHFRAFELSQYYVYEFSGDGVVERPRQICPYVIITFQYTEPKRMSALNHKRIFELENKVFYYPWRGQLSIQGHVLCDIALRSPYTAVIPALLPPKLEMKYVMGVSDLKRMLPAAAFGRSNYSKNEVCYKDISFRLYEVEISNKDQHKLDALLENLKEKELAIIKYLQDQGFLILLASSALTGDKGFDLDKPISLHVLFLFTSSRSCSTDKQELKCENECNEISLKVTSVLPGLQYAIQEARKCPPEEGIPSSILVKRYIQEFAKLDDNSPATSGINDILPLSYDLSPDKTHNVSPSEKCPKQSFSQLQCYISNPSVYSLDMSMVLDCLADGPQSLCGVSDRIWEANFSFVLPPDSVLHDIATEIKAETEKPKNAPKLKQFHEETKVEINPTSSLKTQQDKRKSNRAVVTSSKKKWAPLKILSVADSNRKGTKKKMINVSFPFPKKQGLTANCNEPTLKLANLQFPHKRKRGAEVLSAEFIQRTQSETAAKETSSPEDTDSEIKKPRKLTKPDVKKVRSVEKDVKQTKSKAIKTITKDSCKLKARKQLEPERKETSLLSSNEVPSESQGTANGANETPTEIVATPDANVTLKGSNCESHALNLLADLALSACIPPLAHKDSRSASSYGPSKERRSLRKRKPSRIASDHEYHRVDKHLKIGSSSSKTQNPKLSCPTKPDLRNDLASVPKEKSPVISSRKNGASPNSPKAHPLLSKEVLDSSDGNKHSFIASEHSYASSQGSEHSKKHTFPKGAQGPAAFKNGAKNAKAGPLVGKVLPFRHQQSTSPPQKPFNDLLGKRRRGALSSRLKEDFSKSHTVKSCDGVVKVTRHWEPEYLFNLDSKYTNNSLEKTVIRALHGPWDPALPDDVEEMKLILHMWVALFYSKPSKFLSSTRKVVEHSNPEKYVSINSSLDAFELSDECEGSLDLEKCPADSQSEAIEASGKTLDRSEASEAREGSFGLTKCPADSQSEASAIPTGIHSTVSSSSETPLSSDEPSSTSCIRICSDGDCGDPSSLPLKDGLQEVIVDGCIDIAHTLSKVDEERKESEGALDPVMSAISSTCNPSDKHSDTNVRPEEISADEAGEANQAFNLSEVSQSDFACSQAEFTKKREIMMINPVIMGDDATMSEERQTPDSIALSTEDKDNCQADCEDSLQICGTALLDANTERTKHCSPCGKVRELNDPLENQGRGGEQEEVEEVEEDFDCESIDVEPIDLALSESNDAELGYEDMDQDPMNLVLPKETSTCEDRKAISPVDLESASGSVLTLMLSPGTSPSHEVPAEETTQSADGLPENQEVDTKPSAQSNSVENSYTFREDRGTGSTDVSPSINKSNQSNAAAQRERDSSSPGVTELQNKSSGASEWPCLVFENANVADSEAEESLDKFRNAGVCSAAKKSPCNDGLNQITVVIAGKEHETSLCKLVESACSLSVDNEQSFAKKRLDLNQINFVNHQYVHGLILREEETSPIDQPTQTDPELLTGTPLHQHSSPNRRDTEQHKSVLEQSEHDSVLCKTRTSGHTDQTDLVKRCSISGSQTDVSAADDASNSSDTEQPKKDTVLEHEIPVVKKADLLESEEEISSNDKPTCSNPELFSDVAFQQHNSPVCRETDEHNSLAEQREKKDPEYSKSLNSDHTDQQEVEITSSAVEDFSTSCYTGQAEKDLFLEHEIPVGKVADLLENEDKEPTSCDQSYRGSPCPAASAASLSEDEEEPFAQACEQSSLCERTELLSDSMMEESSVFAALHQTDSEVTREEIPVSSLSMPVTLSACTHSRENLELTGTEDTLEEHLANRGTQFPTKGIGVHLTFENLPSESFSGDSDQEYFGGTTYPTVKFRGSCSSGAVAAVYAVTVGRTNDDCSHIRSGKKSCESDAWDSLEADSRFSAVESGWPTGLRAGDRYGPSFVYIKDDQGLPRVYPNFTVTKRNKDITGTLQCSKRHDRFVEHSDLISSLTRTWKVIDDLTQNTLDMECLRFNDKLKQVIKSRKSQLSTSNSIFPKRFSPVVLSETLPFREAPEIPSVNAPTRSRSPLLVTVVRSDARWRRPSWHQRSDRCADFIAPPLCVPWQDEFSNERNAAKVKSQDRDYGISLHLSKLNYDDKLKESQEDISTILKEYAEFDRVMMKSIHVGNKGRGQSTTSEEPASEREKCTYFPQRAASYETVISDLCNTLHYRLQSVVKEACKNACTFYLVETEDDPFFVRMKSLLKKGGYAEIEPLNFCKTHHLETDRLIAIIRNEDISLHVHKIPSLLRLKLCPNVTFAGVDSPEDIMDHSYQELFHMGGFVVSDDEVLGAVTLGQLKEIVKTLEKLNDNGRWKWLLHYKESKKLREDIRVDSTAHKKSLILKSCEEANTIDVLHYHQCDSKSCTKSEHLKCLLNLQVQHIRARFAVYLTDNPSVSREAFESKGFLVTDVNNFTAAVQKVVAPFKSSYW